MGSQRVKHNLATEKQQPTLFQYCMVLMTPEWSKQDTKVYIWFHLYEINVQNGQTDIDEKSINGCKESGEGKMRSDC